MAFCSGGTVSAAFASGGLAASAGASRGHLAGVLLVGGGFCTVMIIRERKKAKEGLD